jgi:hypothetical protein
VTLLDDLELLRADASALARRVTVARAGGRGVDRSGAVEIVIDPDGRPADVRLRPDWRGAVRSGGLPGAVREAWSNAVLDRLSAWAVAATDPDAAIGTQADGVVPRGRAVDDGQARALGSPPEALARAGTDDGTAAALVWATTDDGAGDVLEWAAAHDGVAAALVRDAAGDGGVGGLSPLPAGLVGEAAGSDPGGRVAVEIRRGEVVALRVDEGWARVADERELGAVVRAALAAALGSGSAADAGNGGQGGALGGAAVGGGRVDLGAVNGGG